MDFPERLVALRKERGLTQKALAEQVRIHVTQIQRYENGSIQPTLDVLRRLAVAKKVLQGLIIQHQAKRWSAA